MRDRAEVARLAHNQKVGSSNLPPATKVMKTCSKCKRIRPLEDFPSQIKNGKSCIIAKCFSCKREYDREFWAKTKARRNSRKVLNRKAIFKRNLLFLRDYFNDNPCVGCGEKDPIVLEFDHVDPSTKTRCVSEMIGLSIRTIKSEIIKCQVLCANCHRRKTANQFNWYSYLDD